MQTADPARAATPGAASVLSVVESAAETALMAATPQRVKLVIALVQALAALVPEADKDAIGRAAEAAFKELAHAV